MNRKFLSAFLLCIFFSGHVNAVIIEGEFGGFITKVIDLGTAYEGYTTFWRDVKIGDAVHGTYWYDTELAPPSSEFRDGKELQYRNHGPDIPVWSGMTTTVDGRVFDITQDQPDPQIWRPLLTDRGVSITNEAYDGFAIIDGFSSINTVIWKTEDSLFSYTTLAFGIGNKNIEFFNSTQLGQEFSWFDENADPNYNAGFIGKTGYTADGQYDAEVRFAVTYTTARIRKPAQVDEPGILLLMLIGITSILAQRRSKQTHVLA